ncbi:MAG: hypothetical protein H7257_08355, partial [Taibaiella sp.]|nr:hypothetical protein [Taibaiella sp.]
MPLPTLNDDLLQSFREEYALVNDQLAILDPLCASLNISAAKRILNNTILILAEFTCYGLFVGGIVLMFMARHLYPLSLIDTIYQSNEITYKLGAPNINSFVIAGYGILLLSSLLFLITGRMASVIR